MRSPRKIQQRSSTKIQQNNTKENNSNWSIVLEKKRKRIDLFRKGKEQIIITWCYGKDNEQFFNIKGKAWWKWYLMMEAW